jgi:predicted methyltransferase
VKRPPSRPAPKKTRNPAETRAAILEAAFEEIYAHGFHAPRGGLLEASMKALVPVFALCVFACSHSGKPAIQPLTTEASADSAISTALAGPTRLETERARDVYRHPHETLEFFGLREDMNVIELWAPDGYYTSILAPLLRDRGKLTVTFWDPAGDYTEKDPRAKTRHMEASGRFLARLDQTPAVFDNVERIAMKPPIFAFGADGTADLVVTFRNIHNWIPEGYEDAVFSAAFRALKPGGVLGVEEHRGLPGMTTQQITDTGYVPEDLVVALANKAGFRLVARSEINANPKDTKDYPSGVWTLPPVFVRKDVDRARYAAIGESDRMTLKFVKPF